MEHSVIVYYKEVAKCPIPVIVINNILDKLKIVYKVDGTEFVYLWEKAKDSPNIQGRELERHFDVGEATRALLAKRKGALFNPQALKNIAEERKKMNELDENGWAHIHHAAFRGFVKSIERFVIANADQLEFETGDELHSTPLHLAVMSGNLETVKCLIDLGANISTVNSQEHGVIELACMKQYLHILEYFINMNYDRLPVWSLLMKFLGSLSDEECEKAGACLRDLLAPADGVAAAHTTDDNGEVVFHHPYWEPALKAGLVNVIVKVIKSSINDEAKIQSFLALLTIMSLDSVKNSIANAGGVPALVKLLRSSNMHLVQLVARCLREMATSEKQSVTAYQAGAIPALVKVVQSVSRDNPDVLSEVVDALGTICETNETHQSAAGREPGAIHCLVSLYEDCLNKHLLYSLTKAIGKLAKEHSGNQDLLVSEGVSSSVITLARVKSRKLQLCAVETIQLLVTNNASTQRRMLDEGAILPLLTLLRRTRNQEMQEKSAGALWALAGNDAEERSIMATQIGVPLLIEFVQSVSEKLHFIGAEGIGVLAQGAVNEQDFIGQQNGVQPLVRLLRSDKEEIVLSAVRALRSLCVGVGFVPNPRNQNLINLSRGIKFLVALMVHAKNEIIQVESSLALAYAAMGNAEVQRELQSNPEFSYVRILKMLYVHNRSVQLLAGATLAAFAYNNISEQKEVAAQGGIRFGCLRPFLSSENEYERCMAAFQVVVLARIIPDEEQALSSATGIKLIVDLLCHSIHPDIKALAADCVARLSHTRAGVPQAMVSIGVVPALCRLMLAEHENVRGCSAIAVSYLAHNPNARREILHRFRQDPYLMNALRHYVSVAKLDPEFVGGWRHYMKVGLPPIQPGRPQLVQRKSIDVFKDQGRQLTLLSLDSDNEGEPGGGGGGIGGGGGSTIPILPGSLTGRPTQNENSPRLTARQSSRSVGSEAGVLPSPSQSRRTSTGDSILSSNPSPDLES